MITRGIILLGCWISQAAMSSSLGFLSVNLGKQTAMTKGDNMDGWILTVEENQRWGWQDGSLPALDFCVPRCGRRESTSESCPLTSISTHATSNNLGSVIQPDTHQKDKHPERQK